jgi:hypothetical protein
MAETAGKRKTTDTEGISPLALFAVCRKASPRLLHTALCLRGLTKLDTISARHYASRRKMAQARTSRALTDFTCLPRQQPSVRRDCVVLGSLKD